MEQPSNSHDGVVRLQPELLMAAKDGHWRSIEELMSREGTPDMEEGDEHCCSDSALHVVASGGDGEEFLMSATVICRKAKHLLGARNAMGDTPLHCAARAESIKMVSHLIDLARRGEDDGASTMAQAVLRKQNKRGETALHEAVRWADEKMVGKLLSADAELARFPRANGASPLYLAILLEHHRIADLLYKKDNQLSYSGPDGQNALHAAVLRSKRMTKKLLKWNVSLIKQGDRLRRSTPLHFAASWKFENLLKNILRFDSTTSMTAKILLEADQSSAYQSDAKGSFPIHVAALANNMAVARVLLEKCPGCVHLRDAHGRTFLHIAAFKGYRIAVWDVASLLLEKSLDAWRLQRFACFMNLQDCEGNTALHHAAMAGKFWIICSLIPHKEVQLNLQNNKGQTPLDLTKSRRPPRVFSVLDSTMRIRRLLMLAGARSGVHRSDQEQAPLINGEKQEDQAPLLLNGKNQEKQAPLANVEEEEEENIKDSTTTIGVVSVLILTISFAAIFQLPGGYSTGDDKPEGTPELAFKYSFQAFVVANNLAASCSALATICLMYAGITMTTMDIQIRRGAIGMSVFLVNSAARSLAAAFAFGTYAVLAPVARAATVITWVLTGFMLLDIVWLALMVTTEHTALLKRRGTLNRAPFKFMFLFASLPFSVLWPYIVIAGFVLYLKVHGIH